MSGQAENKNEFLLSFIDTLLYYDILHSLCKQASGYSDVKIALAHARYTFNPGDKITK
jgi:hypothetical protein